MSEDVVVGQKSRLRIDRVLPGGLVVSCGGRRGWVNILMATWQNFGVELLSIFKEGEYVEAVIYAEGADGEFYGSVRDVNPDADPFLPENGVLRVGLRAIGRVAYKLGEAVVVLFGDVVKVGGDLSAEHDQHRISKLGVGDLVEVVVEDIDWRNRRISLRLA